MNFAAARYAMVESQLRPNKVTDARILSVMSALPRENFVPEPLRTLAYMDGAVTVADGAPGRRQLLAPMVLARLVQAVEIRAGDRVLDVGCATGYSTALLAGLAGYVIGLECNQALAETARRNLASLGISNASIKLGDLAAAYPDQARYDAIVLNGSVTTIPQCCFEQLKEGARLAAIIARPGEVGKVRVHLNVNDEISSWYVFDAAAQPLPISAEVPGFVF